MVLDHSNRDGTAARRKSKTLLNLYKSQKPKLKGFYLFVAVVCQCECMCVCMCRCLVVFLLLPWRAICSPSLQWVNRQAAWYRVYLFHGCQGALQVEKACHLEAVGPAFEEPRLKRTVPLKELSKPEPQGVGGMWCWERKKRKENVKKHTI